jgi:ANTAR domain-containing protein
MGEETQTRGRDGHEDRDPEFWRARAEQLQEALNSRIVIEQAKGMLRERFGLDTQAAFALMRSAARGKQMSIHLLAGMVTSSFATPEPIIRALAEQPEMFTAMSREERVTQSEEFFRRLNEAIAEKLMVNRAAFFCECANPYCNVTVKLGLDDLKQLHSMDGYYAMRPGHQIPELETVVVERPDYIVTQAIRSH